MMSTLQPQVSDCRLLVCGFIDYNSTRVLPGKFHRMLYRGMNIDMVVACFQFPSNMDLQVLAKKESNCWTQFALQSKMTIFSISHGWPENEEVYVSNPASEFVGISRITTKNLVIPQKKRGIRRIFFDTKNAQKRG